MTSSKTSSEQGLYRKGHTRIRGKWQCLTVREQILTGVAAITVLVVVLCYGIIGPYLSHTQELEDAIAYEVIRLEKSLRQVERGPHIERWLRQLRHRYQEVVSQLIPGTTLPLAAARLQEHVQRIATQSQAQIVRVKVLRGKQVREFHRAGVQLSLRGDMEAVAAFLAAIEHDSWLLTIDTLYIRGSGRRRRRHRRRVPHKPRPPLAVEVTIGGFLQGSVTTEIAKDTKQRTQGDAT